MKIHCRFTNIPISQATNVLNAKIQFLSLGGGDSSSLDIFGDISNAAVCPGYNASRQLTSASVTWTPGAWVANGT